MSKIKKLSLQEIQKIAAGEVVERPANVVKELVENALDAGATQITLYLEDGGKQSIRIIDNGSGMAPDDVRRCIEHHTTSKITGIHDLPTLITYGFRGEALSSIASVSEITITSKESTSLEGIRIIVRDGAIVSEEIIGCPPGTDIIITHLFYNVPARKKFLKTRDTELRAIITLMQAYCLVYTTCHFKVYHQEKLLINCAATTNQQSRTEQLFDAPLPQRLLSCSFGHSTLSLHITAYISDPQYSRYDRSLFFFFVNKRWIRNTKLGNAIMQGYAHVLPAGKFPAIFTMITIDPSLIDVNIHPRKEEVQFLHPQRIEHILKTMVTERLNKYRSQQIGGIDTEPSIIPSSSSYQTTPAIPHEPITYTSFAAILDQRLPSSPKELHYKEIQIPLSSSPHDTQQNNLQQQEHVPPLGDYYLKGQLLATYILIETKEGLVLIDQHAAHERILYEQFAIRFRDIPRTSLIFPLVLTFSHKDSLLLQQYTDVFVEHGIILNQQTECQFVITELPVHANDHNMEQFIHQVLGWIHELSHLAKELFFQKMHERMRAQMACKAAVKAGDTLSDTQLHELIKSLKLTPHRLTCPHGRPTSWLITKDELEKIFKRKQ
jgi:DNA mismatch repair protein MutL